VPDRSDPMPAEPRALFQKLGITGPFILSVGSMEYQRRDNLWVLIDAFAKLPVELRQTHQLVLTYALSSEDRKHVRRSALDRGVADQFVITDRLADKALRALYQRCAAFVSLTSYEELGLPILEAMHCGAPVVVGNTEAQIEVIGDAGLIFNVTDAAALSIRLVEVLNDSAWARRLGEQALVQAGRFHWNKTADAVLDVLTRANAANAAYGFALAVHQSYGGPSPMMARRQGLGTGSASVRDRPFFADFRGRLTCLIDTQVAWMQIWTRSRGRQRLEPEYLEASRAHNAHRPTTEPRHGFCQLGQAGLFQ
jgi:hypothetical protein